jgi:hypothetical protein
LRYNREDVSFAPLTVLRRRPTRRLFSLLATLALLFAGFAQAAHVHQAAHVNKGDTARTADTHLQCLLCLHVDRSAGPPELPQVGTPALTASTLVHTSEAPNLHRFTPRCYDARGPPLV